MGAVNFESTCHVYSLTIGEKDRDQTNLSRSSVLQVVLARLLNCDSINKPVFTS